MRGAARRRKRRLDHEPPQYCRRRNRTRRTLAACPSTADADHRRYEYESANLGEIQGANNRHTFVPNPWLSQQTAGWCTSPALSVGPAAQALTDAVKSWNDAFAWPFTDLTLKCGAGQHISILDRGTNQAAFPADCLGFVGCYQGVQNYDSFRMGYYTTSAKIWINDVNYEFPSYNGLRATIAHEFGHFYGLDESYHHDLTCNGSIDSIMDAISPMYDTNGNGKLEVMSGCDGYLPKYYDIYHIDLMYRMWHPGFQPVNLASVKTGTNTMTISWDDASPSEWGYPIYLFYYQSGWRTVPGVGYQYQVAPGDHAQTIRLTWPIQRPSGYPVTNYMACMHTKAAVFGDIAYHCFPNQVLGQ